MPTTKTRPLTIRIAVDVADWVDALAHRHHVEPTEIVRRFIAAGLEANPAPSEDELTESRAKKRAKREGRVPGLVIPLSPVAIAANSNAVTQPSAALVTEAAEGGVEKMGIHRLTRCAPKLRAA